MSSIQSREKATLTDLHWTVVAIARADPVHSAKDEGRVMRFLRWVTGLAAAPGLADPRLEALRRFCVVAWHRKVVGARTMRTLADAGYAKSDTIEILAHISRCRGFPPRIQGYLD